MHERCTMRQTDERPGNRTSTPAPEPIESLMNVKQASKVLGISPFMLYELVENGEIAHIRVGRLIRFRRKDLIEYMDRNYNGVRA
jgi:excisionase family DNA binding protein